jgi:hypothetical protein
MEDCSCDVIKALLICLRSSLSAFGSRTKALPTAGGLESGREFFFSIDADSRARTGRTAAQAGKTRICFYCSFVTYAAVDAAWHVIYPDRGN